MKVKSKRLVVWGDSLAKGVIYDSSRDRHVFLPETGVNIISKILGIEIINKAKYGLTVTKGFEIIKRDLDSNINCDSALIEFGGNDCDFNWEEVSSNPNKSHIPNTPIETFKEYIIKIIDLLKQNCIRPILTTLPPIDDDKYFDFITRKGLSRDNILTWLGDKHQIYRHQELYSNQIPFLAKKMGCDLIDYRTIFLSQRNYKDYLCEDGIHPNKDGQKLIGTSIIQVLENEA